MKQRRPIIRKRIPIRRRFLVTVLLTTILSILTASVTGYLCIRWIRRSAEANLTEQLQHYLRTAIQEKVNSVDARMEHYEKYVQLVADTVSDMYENEEGMRSLGKIFYAPTDSHEYELTRAFASPDLTEANLRSEILFYSNLEKIWRPIANENKDLITTMFLGTKNGLLVSYDRYSYLSSTPEGKELIYNYFTSEWYKRGMKEEGVFYTDVYMDSQGRGLTVTVASGVKDSKGRTVGVTAMDFDLTALYNELFAINSERGTFAFALDHKDTIISPEADTLDLLEYTGLTLDELDALKEDPDGLMEKDGSYYVCIPLERVGWTLCARVQKEAIQNSVHGADSSMRTAAIIFVIIVLLVLGGAVVAVDRFVRAVTHPLELLERDIKIISELLGHSSTEITYRIYVHVIESLKASAVEGLDLY